jgi:hypothetical protein
LSDDFLDDVLFWCHFLICVITLQCRTRASLLASLVDELRCKSMEFLGQSPVSPAPDTPKAEKPDSAGSRFIESVRKVITRKNPSNSETSLNAANINNNNIVSIRKAAAPKTPGGTDPNQPVSRQRPQKEKGRTDFCLVFAERSTEPEKHRQQQQ